MSQRRWTVALIVWGVGWSLLIYLSAVFGQWVQR